MALLLYGIDLFQVSQTYCPAPDKVIETFPLLVALAAAVTVKTFESVTEATRNVPSVADPEV